jgi:hypothetical protein
MNGKENAATLFGGLIEPLGRCLTPQSAREIVALRPSEPLERRIGELAERSDTGQFTPEERAEYQLFVEVGDMIALMQARARRFLTEQSGS